MVSVTMFGEQRVPKNKVDYLSGSLPSEDTNKTELLSLRREDTFFTTVMSVVRRKILFRYTPAFTKFCFLFFIL